MQRVARRGPINGCVVGSGEGRVAGGGVGSAASVGGVWGGGGPVVGRGGESRFGDAAVHWFAEGVVWRMAGEDGEALSGWGAMRFFGGTGTVRAQMQIYTLFISSKLILSLFLAFSSLGPRTHFFYSFFILCSPISIHYIISH